MMTDRQAFGDRLRRHREHSGISLEQVADTTKISAALFSALERGDCSKWPAGLYGRAYIRAYADTVGLSPDETVEEFNAAFSGKPAAAVREERAAIRSRRPQSDLRLGLADDTVTPMRLLQRTALAGADLAIAVALAWTTYTVLDPGVWVTLAAGLGYQGASRVVSDEPLVCWAYRRVRAATVRADAAAEDQAEVPVGGTARSAA
jgi:transcriptional regulator with XRE-family HTH domain